MPSFKSAFRPAETIMSYKGHIWGTSHHGKRVHLSHQHNPLQPVGFLQLLANLQNGTSRQEQQKLKCSLGHEADHLKREGLSGESNLPIYEYLSLALSKSATHPVQLYGCVDAVDAHFLRRAELLLTILRSFSILEKAPNSQAAQEHFALLLPEASDLLCSILSGSTKPHKQ